MKFHLSLIVAGFFCIEIVNSYILSSSPSGGATPLKNGVQPSFAQTPSPNIQSDDIFRQEYHEWAKRYGKSTGDETRFENFKLNFMLQMRHNKKTGIFNLLNEFGDMTSKEFEEKKNSNATKNREIETTATAKSEGSSENVVEVELIVDEESFPKVRTLDSRSIPRVTPFGSPTSSNYDRHRQRQARRTQKVSLDAFPARPRYSSRDMAYDIARRQTPAYVSRDPQGSPDQPRVCRQDQANVPPPQPRRKRRLVRVGPDRIL